MRKIITWVSTCCLFCLATVTAVLIVGDLKARITHAIQPTSRSSLVMIADPRAAPSAVFEALVDNSFEIFITDDLTGQARQLTWHFGNDRFPALSPDGKQVAFVSWRDGDSEIYVIDLATGALRNLSNDPGKDMLAGSAWSPDSSMLAYTSRRDDHLDITVADVSRRLTQNLTRSPHHDRLPEWMPDSQHLVFTSDRDGTRAQYVIDVGGRTLITYQSENEWQTVQNPDNLDISQRTISG